MDRYDRTQTAWLPTARQSASTKRYIGK